MRHASLILLVSICLSAMTFGAPRGTSPVSISKVRFDAVPLRDAIDYIRDRSGLNIHVNWSEIERAGVAETTPVSIELQQVSARRALQMVLDQAAGGRTLTFYVDRGIVHITSQAEADRQHITRVYVIGDLLVAVPDFSVADLDVGNSGSTSTSGRTSDADKGVQPLSRAERQEQIVSLITSTIEPDVWRDNGGTASIVIFNDRMVVTAPRSVHIKLGLR